MHIVVCMKQVPDTTEVRINPKTNTLQREGVPSIINPYDVHAIEAALRLKDWQGGRVTVLTMGPEQAKESLRKAVSYGVDKAILLSDRAFAGSDTLATSYILAQAIKRIRQEDEVDLILCGKQAIDGDTAQVGPGIATRLGLPLLTYVTKIEFADEEKRIIRVQRKLEDRQEVVEARLPALLTVEKGINELRYATLPDMLRAARYQFTVWNKDDIRPDPAQIGLKGSPTWVNRIFAPPQRERGQPEMWHIDEVGPETAAAELTERLVTRVLVANT